LLVLGGKLLKLQEKEKIFIDQIKLNKVSFYHNFRIDYSIVTSLIIECIHSVGLFHGKDIRFGSSISHSHAKTNRSWKPNVQDKRLWSDALNQWVRFKITTAGLKAVDTCGGIDYYLLNLDDKLVEDSNYITKMRGLVVSALNEKGELPPKFRRHLQN
jgi:ribosomal protein L28